MSSFTKSQKSDKKQFTLLFGHKKGKNKEFEANHSFNKERIAPVTLYLKTTFSPIALYKKNDRSKLLFFKRQR